MFNLLTKDHPFKGKNLPELQHNLLNNPPNLDKLDDEKHGKVKDLLQKIFVKDPEERITLMDILDHPWITRDGQSIIELDLSSLSSQDQSEQKNPMSKMSGAAEVVVNNTGSANSGIMYDEIGEKDDESYETLKNIDNC